MPRRHAMRVETLKLASQAALVAQQTREGLLERIRVSRKPGAEDLVALIGNAREGDQMHPVVKGWERRLRAATVVPKHTRDAVLELAVSLGDRLAELGDYPPQSGVGRRVEPHFVALLDAGDVQGCFDSLLELAVACDDLESVGA